MTPWWDLDMEDRELTPQERGETAIALGVCCVICALAIVLWLVG